MHFVSCTNTHRDVTYLVNHGMFKNTKTWISWEWNIISLWNFYILPPTQRPSFSWIIVPRLLVLLELWRLALQHFLFGWRCLFDPRNTVIQHSTLIVHFDSGFQRKAGPLNQQASILCMLHLSLLNHHGLGCPLMRHISIVLTLNFCYPLDPVCCKDLKMLPFIISVAQDDLALCPLCLFIVVVLKNE